MFEIGDKVGHFEYGGGEVVSVSEDNYKVIVVFEEKHEVFLQRVIDEKYYYEDASTMTLTDTIEVLKEELRYLGSSIYKKDIYTNKCHTCKQFISSETHAYCIKCSWLKCDCGSCKCNYTGRKFLRK